MRVTRFSSHQPPLRPHLNALGLILVLASSLPAAPQSLDEPTPAERLFALQVKPLLASKCLPCHGADPTAIKGGLDLTSLQGMRVGGDTSDEVLLPGNAAASLLYLATTWEDPAYRMPPKEADRLDQTASWALRDWINAGAPWPDDARVATIATEYAEGQPVATSGGLSPDWTARRYKPADLWAYRPVVKPPIPHTSSQSPNPIDAFLQQRLDELGLEPAPRANRRTLIRRLTYNLSGLPPTPAEIATFLSDPAPDDDAYARLVDRLLASPHHGEQWARHWLDVVRYADSAGLANDYERGNAWRYRDYVVRAFNTDKPYNQFIREQLAGDELDPANPEALIAVGFLRTGPWELTGMEVPKVARQRFLDDVTDTIGQVFLAQPLQCARCHDHKFEPIPTRDYYRLQAALATSQLAERPVPFLDSENTSGFEERQYLLSRRAAYLMELEQLDEKSIAAGLRWYADKNADPQPFETLIRDLKSRPDRNTGNLFETARRTLMQRSVAETDLPPRHAGFEPADFGRDRIARKGLERLSWELDRYQPIALSVYSGRTPDLKSVYNPLRLPPNPLQNGELEQTAILAGGDPFSPTVPVPPGALSAIDTLALGLPPSQFPDSITGRRQALADWIANPHNPLTTRSIVNRVWQWHFGVGLCATPNNFGAMGNRPTHPELLDYLAAEFVEQGWSIQWLDRLILTSEAYRRSSRHPAPSVLAQKDPESVSHAVFRPRRLAAEEIRDSMLAITGELNPTLGGIPIRPEINPEAAFQPRQVMGTFASAWQPSPRPDQRHRRTIYALHLRGLRDPFLEVFNAPSPDLSCERRDNSTITPQVFSLFNSQSSRNRALALAHRLMHERPDPESRIQLAFELVHGRHPTPPEQAACLNHWTTMTTLLPTDPPPPPQRPHSITRVAVDENTAETFTFLEPLEMAADFIPDLQPHQVDLETRALAEVCLVLLNSNAFLTID